MPENTVTEFRGRNKYGHRSKNDRKQRNRSSSPPKKIGNIKSHRSYCTYCAPELASTMERRFIIQEEFKEINKKISKNKSVEEILDTI